MKQPNWHSGSSASEGYPFGGPVAVRLGVGGPWSTVERTWLGCLAEHLPAGLPDVLLLADDDLDGWARYPECVADQPSTPIPNEVEGDLLQYSSGTTGRLKGIRRELSHLPPAQAPNMLMPLLGAVGITGESVYLSPAPLYHTAR